MLRAFQYWIATKWLELDQDNLRMKFSALKVDFSSLSPDPLSSWSPAQAGVKDVCYSSHLESPWTLWTLLSTVDRRLLFVAGGDSRIFAPRSRRSPSVVVFALLLLRAGVESNPGPDAVCVTGVVNCRSANHKIPVIHDLITDRNMDVLLLSETWFTFDTPQSILLDVAPAGYAALHVVRPTGPGKPKRGGKLAAVFRESVLVRVHHLASTLAPRTFELQLLRVGTGSGSCMSFSIVYIYRPPWMSSVSNFVDELATSSLCSQPTPVAT